LGLLRAKSKGFDFTRFINRYIRKSIYAICNNKDPKAPCKILNGDPMGYIERAFNINWKDEFNWIVISLISGIVLSLVFAYYDRFPLANHSVVASFCCIGFYILSILIRAQNYRGKTLTGKKAFNEKYLKFVFPVLGFAIGFALIFFD
jgi:hypothetical protein